MFFTYHRRSKPTGELLAAMLQLPHGLEPTDEFGNDLLIRWGNRVINHVDDGSFERVVNNCEALALCSHKLYSLELMEGAGIKVPAYSDDPYALVENMGWPILGRKFHHARGTDIKLCLQERDLRRPMDYYVAYIPTNREYRIHVVGDEVIRVQGKYLDIRAQQVPWMRNYSTGYRFRKPRMRLREDRLTMAVSAVKSLGLDFGAVDLIVADDGSCYVLEVNTAPSCSPLTLGAYATALHKHFNLDTEIDLSVVSMLDNEIEEMDSDDEVEGEDLNA